MFATGRSDLLYKDLIKEVSEASILEYYSGISNIPCKITSPFREESHPSFSVMYSQTGRINLKDFGTGENYNLIGFLMKFLNLSTYIQVINMIEQDLAKIKPLNKHIINSRPITSSGGNHKTSNIERDLRVKIREWRDYDIKFWNKYGISLARLQFGNVFPVSQIFRGNLKFPAEQYSYVYVEFKDNKHTYKIYQPYSEKYKWTNSHDASVWDLWTQAMRSKSNKLIITSSRKDALVLWEHLNIPSVSLQSENTLPKAKVVKQLQNKFEDIYCLYDNDAPGVTAATRLSKEFNFKTIFIPKEWGSKDPSDLYKNHGKQTFIKIINNLIIHYGN